MNITTPLFEGRCTCLAPIDHEQDPAIVSNWTQNADYLRMLDTKPALPLSAGQIKKQYEVLEKEIDRKQKSGLFCHPYPPDNRRFRTPDRLCKVIWDRLGAWERFHPNRNWRSIGLV